jgi:hypothetical protein
MGGAQASERDTLSREGEASSVTWLRERERHSPGVRRERHTLCMMESSWMGMRCVRARWFPNHRERVLARETRSMCTCVCVFESVFLHTSEGIELSPPPPMLENPPLSLPITDRPPTRVSDENRRVRTILLESSSPLCESHRQQHCIGVVVVSVRGHAQTCSPRQRAHSIIIPSARARH